MPEALLQPVSTRAQHPSTELALAGLCSQLQTYLSPEQIESVRRAFRFGAKAHEGQVRLSGEPYILHPLEVAKTMAEMRMDAQSIVAGILHDVIEDTATVKGEIAVEFGPEVAELVDGVSKLTHLSFSSRQEAQAANLRKMMLAMVQDLRVIMVKLADRLHNMRTLGVMPTEKRRRIARETLEIYAPIAQRLGMNAIRRELEALGFAALYPLRHRILENAVRKTRGNRKAVLKNVEAAISGRLKDSGIDARVYGREKSVYSIYKKMRAKRIDYTQIYDVFAFRIVVGDVDTCYRTLGVMHGLHKPLPGRFKDYIAIPKANGYQSLHTSLFGPHGIAIEVQIRNEEMDRVAESGIAAHWLYKTSDGKSARTQARAREWLSDVLEIQQNAGNPLEFLESVKVDLFPDEVYIFTPAGEIMSLPRGATVVDFAYRVHSALGNTCVAARIDLTYAPLSTVLVSGQTVEVITAPSARPKPVWLNFVVTAKARNNIRHYLKNLRRDEATQLGRSLLEKALAARGQKIEDLDGPRIARLLTDLNVFSMDALLEDIGLGNRLAELIARRLAGPMDEHAPPSEQKPLMVQGTEGMVLNFAKCCHPIPGDPIAGILSAGRGLVIHRENCHNVLAQRDRVDKCVPVLWTKDCVGEFATSIRVQASNQRGMLATLAARIADSGSNIDNVSIDERDGMTVMITFLITVHHRSHLARIIRGLRGVPQVFKVIRTKG